MSGLRGQLGVGEGRLEETGVNAGRKVCEETTDLRCARSLCPTAAVTAKVKERVTQRGSVRHSGTVLSCRDSALSPSV